MIHGAQGIGAAYAKAGHTVDVIDIDRGATTEAIQNAMTYSCDLITAPVHRDPDHSLLTGNTPPVLTYHEAGHKPGGEDGPPFP